MATLHSRYIRGSLVYWQNHQKRLIDAIGQNVVKYIDDFVAGPGIDTAFDNDWTVTRVEAGAGESTMTRIDGVGGLARITTDAADNDGINAQLIGEAFELTSDQELYFGAFGVTLDEATQSDLFLGLAITDTTILGGATDSIGFRKVDASADLTFVVEKDSTETIVTGLATVADATALDLEFYFDGTNLEVFVNGISVATPAVTNLPDNEQMRVSWHFLTGEAVAHTCDTDAIRAIQIGR